MKRIALLGLILLTLMGCIDYNEELWLNKDGSGKVKMLIGALTTYENPQEINRYVDQPGIHLISKSVYRKKNYTYYKLEFNFDSIESFNNLNDQISNADFFGRISLIKEKDGSFTMKRRIALGSMSGEEDEIEQLIFTHPQEKLKWRYKMHLPWKVIKANADNANIDYQTNTVSWEYQTSFLWNKSQTMTVNMKQTFPYVSVLVIGLAFLIVLLSLLWWRRHINKLHKKLAVTPVEEQPKE
jgi:hypothetical protein